jgi:hypothetical protein
MTNNNSRFINASFTIFAGAKKSPGKIQGCFSEMSVRPRRTGNSIFFHPDYTVGAGIPPVQFEPPAPKSTPSAQSRGL